MDLKKQDEKLNNANRDFYPVYHFAPVKGWINDPNGFIYSNGKYHLFYQYYPDDTVWGPMHWGHSISEDLVAFNNLPIALYPNGERESGCFSGGAINIEKDKLLLLYTRHYENNGIVEERQFKAISEDGINFLKSLEPILDLDMLPKDLDIHNFRDPNPVLIDGVYYVVVGSKTKEGKGVVLIYSSIDMKNFSYFTTIKHECFGSMAECPDLFNYNDKQILLFSALDITNYDILNHGGRGSYYAIGNLDKNNKIFKIENVGVLDQGTDYYAVQSTKSPDNRRILIAWADLWNNSTYLHDINHISRGCYTLPRELSLKDNKINLSPIREIFNYEGKVLNVLKGSRITKSFVLKAVFKNESKLTFGNDKDFINIIVEDNMLFVESKQSHHLSYKQKIGKTKDSFNLIIFSDKNTLEIFIEDLKPFTTQVIIDGKKYLIKDLKNITGEFKEIVVENKI